MAGRTERRRHRPAGNPPAGPERLKQDFPFPDTGYFVDAQAKGYSGVALYLPRRPDRLVEGIGRAEFDAEGRWLQADFGDLSIVSLYLPSGSSGEPVSHSSSRRWTGWQKFEDMAGDGRRYIVCGDYSIAHRAHRPEELARQPEELRASCPKERAWMERLLVERGWVDNHRQLKARYVAESTPGGQSRPGLGQGCGVAHRLPTRFAESGRAPAACVSKEDRFSDHAPLIVDYRLEHLRRSD